MPHKPPSPLEKPEKLEESAKHEDETNENPAGFELFWSLFPPTCQKERAEVKKQYRLLSDAGVNLHFLAVVTALRLPFLSPCPSPLVWLSSRPWEADAPDAGHDTPSLSGPLVGGEKM